MKKIHLILILLIFIITQLFSFSTVIALTEDSNNVSTNNETVDGNQSITKYDIKTNDDTTAVEDSANTNNTTKLEENIEQQENKNNEVNSKITEENNDEEKVINVQE